MVYQLGDLAGGWCAVRSSVRNCSHDSWEIRPAVHGIFFLRPEKLLFSGWMKEKKYSSDVYEMILLCPQNRLPFGEPIHDKSVLVQSRIPFTGG